MFGLCLLGLGSLRAGMTCYINRAEPKERERKKKTTLGENYPLSTLGRKRAQAYPRPDVVQAGGSWQGAIY